MSRLFATTALIAAFADGGVPQLPASIRCDLYPSAHLIATTNEVRQVTIGDVDADGAPDLVVAANTSASVEILRNLGEGTFASIQVVAHSGSSVHSVLGDLDGDGDPDLVVASSGGTGPRISVHLNDGRGHFALGVDLPYTSMHSVLADIDQDGDPDLVTAGNTLRVFLNDGTGSFAAPSQIGGTGSTSARAVFVMDFTGDDLPDIVVVRDLSVIALVTGQGAGAFAPPVLFSAGSTALDAAAGDFDDDFDIDIAVANGNDETVTIILNDGKGGWSLGPVIDAGLQSSRLALADIDLDGDVDLAVLSQFRRATMLLLNRQRETGTFGTFSRRGSMTAYEPFGIAATDLDGDGMPDLAVTADKRKAVAILFNRGAADLHAGHWIPGFTQMSGLSTGDIDGDGLPDLVVARSPGGTQNAVRVLRNDGAGNYEPFIALPTTTAPAGTAVADFNGDGINDIVATRQGSPQGYLLVQLNTGGGAFAAPAAFGGSGSGGSIRPGDLDNDGDLDVVLAHSTLGAVILQNDGTGTFSVLGSVIGGGTSGMVLADVDNDGDLDLVTAGGGSMVVWSNDGTGALGNPTSYIESAGTSYTDLTAGDFDADGAIDLAAPISNGSSMRVRWNNGDGTFGAAMPLPLGGVIGQYAESLRSVDVDGDGIADLVACSSNLQALVVRRSNGDRSFKPPVRLTAGDWPTSLTTADLDLDGRVDLICMRSLYTIGIFRNLGPWLDDDADGVPNCEDLCLEGDDAVDRNGNGIPDACEPGACPADLDGNGIVGAVDLAILLGQWGEAGTADLDASGQVGAADLAIMLGAWGPC